MGDKVKVEVTHEKTKDLWGKDLENSHWGVKVLEDVGIWEKGDTTNVCFTNTTKNIEEGMVLTVELDNANLIDGAYHSGILD